MSDYIQLVLVKHPNDCRRFLFRAPISAILKVGDLVMVETRFGEKEATVEALMSVSPGSEAYKFAIITTGAKEPLMPVIARAVWVDIPKEGGDEFESDNGKDA